MYGWLLRNLPGSGATRALLLVVLLAVAGAVLWYLVFPLLEPSVTLDEVTVRK
jgi:hypothetical protein